MTIEGELEPSVDEIAKAATAALNRTVSSVSAFDEGMNAVYRVSFADGQDAVLKTGTVTEGSKLLSGPVLIKRVSQETNIPVPEVLSIVPEEDSYIGHAYFLMEYVNGRTLTDVNKASSAAHEQLVQEGGQHLAMLHKLSFDGPFGRLHASDDDLTVGYEFHSWAETYQSEVKYALDRLGTRFEDLEPALRNAIDTFPAVIDEQSVDKSILYRDYHPKNLILEPNDNSDPLVRAVVDFNFRPVGDAPLDIAIAEMNLVNLPVGGTNRAGQLRNDLRNSYVETRGGTHSDYFDECYPYYQLVPTLDYMCHFEYFGEFGWEDDIEMVAGRLREFVQDRLDEISS